MNIAQSQIAGEATLRLHDIELHAAELAAALSGQPPPSAELDHPADADPKFVVDTTRLPYLVLQAIRRAQSLTALPARARHALGAIAMTVDQKAPLHSVFARRSYLARRAGQSPRTLKRAMDDLVDACLIRVDEQGRKSDGTLGGAYIYLTERAAQLLGYLAPTATASAPQVREQAPEQAKAPAPALFPQPSATVSDGAIYRFYQSPLVQKRQPGTLPADVQPLQSMGFSTFHIFAMMRSARVDHGKRLGDVVSVAGDLIAKATSPRAYLATLLRSPTDFAFLARQRRETTIRKAQEAASAQTLAALQERLAGRVFYERDAAKRYEVSATGVELFVRDPAEGAARVAARGWIAGVEQGLRTASLVPATEGLDARFAERLAAGLANRRLPAGIANRAGAPIAAARGATNPAGGVGRPMAEGDAQGVQAGLRVMLPARVRSATVASHLAQLRGLLR
ncbi:MULTISPECIES: hypothetical protein [Cupriavidus]